MMAPLVTLTLPGRPIVKKNTQRVVGRGRSKRVIYSAAYTSWQKNAMAGLPRPVELMPRKKRTVFLLDCDVEAHFKFYFKDRQGEADVSNLVEGPQDLLVSAGILKDDRLVKRLIAEKFFGAKSPRVEIEIYKYEESK